MKQKVFLYSYGAPILLLLIVFIRAQMGATTFGVVSSFLFFLSIFFLSLLNDKRYLQHWSINEERVSLTYMNQFFQVKTIERARADLSYLQLSKRAWYSVIWPSQLHLKTEEEYKGFYIISREMYQQLRAEIPSIHASTVNATGS